MNFQIPKINDEVRLNLKVIFDSQISSYKKENEYIKWHKSESFLTGEDKINNFDNDSINIMRDYDNNIVMKWFAFSVKNTLRLYKLLKLNDDKMKNSERWAAARILPNRNVPIHVDPNFNFGREKIIHNITVGGSDSLIHFSNRKDGNSLLTISGLVDWTFYPTLMPHGAITGKESLDLIQIILE